MAKYTGNMAGGNLTLADGDEIVGQLHNLNRLYIPAGVTVRVPPFNGIGGGWVQVVARIIQLDGTIDAQGAGYPGGEGGDGGDSGGLTGEGSTAVPAELSCLNPQPFHPGQAGAPGGGPRQGAAGAQGYAGVSSTQGGPGGAGGIAGYAGAGVNGDISLDESVTMGSGGGGGGGGGGGPMGIKPLSNCNYGGGGGGGGGAGAPGGGKVVLEALWNFQGTGQIITAAADSFGDGIPGGNAMCRFDPGAGGPGGTPAGAGAGQGGNGGLGCWDSGVNQQSGAGEQTGNKGGNGGTGGAGAGGGVLIVCRGPWDLAFTGAINTRGSTVAATSWGSTNYGSCKIFGLPGRAAFNGVKECGHLGAGGWGSPLVRETKHWAHPVC